MYLNAVKDVVCQHELVALHVEGVGSEADVWQVTKLKHLNDYNITRPIIIYSGVSIIFILLKYLKEIFL